MFLEDLLIGNVYLIETMFQLGYPKQDRFVLSGLAWSKTLNKRTNDHDRQRYKLCCNTVYHIESQVYVLLQFGSKAQGYDDRLISILLKFHPTAITKYYQTMMHQKHEILGTRSQFFIWVLFHAADIVIVTIYVHARETQQQQRPNMLLKLPTY
ncbi:hypothetical protein A0J61_07586 [Choanephora cucurbitarum]|uniref:Uncharacterized protein n=1 Tax=Choanephora cucurbitarum TaxID=101091 RepID=A0A1C7N5I4_9FUNG|nr:hypothetical protein A0J61_07586 [Choanephora cucurbitarum]